MSRTIGPCPECGKLMDYGDCYIEECLCDRCAGVTCPDELAALDEIRAQYKPKPLKRASYREAVSMIALNDEPGDLDVRSVAYTTTCLLIADIFGAHPVRVGWDVVAYRRKHMGGE